MEKKKYTQPEYEILLLEKADIIKLSTESWEDETGGGGGGEINW